MGEISGVQVSKADQDRASGGSGRGHLSYGLSRGPSLTWLSRLSPGLALEWAKGAVDWNLPRGGDGDEEAGSRTGGRLGW